MKRVMDCTPWRILALRTTVGLFLNAANALVREMMFGFGDSIEPYPETVKLMDDLVKDFITNLVSTLSFEPFL